LLALARLYRITSAGLVLMAGLTAGGATIGPSRQPARPRNEVGNRVKEADGRGHHQHRNDLRLNSHPKIQGCQPQVTVLSIHHLVRLSNPPANPMRLSLLPHKHRVFLDKHPNLLFLREKGTSHDHRSSRWL
jgi:hypothetical protein